MSVKDENKAIEKRFKCNITVPYLSMEQLELLENGFPVKPNFEIKLSPDNKEILQKLIKNYTKAYADTKVSNG